MPEGRNSFKKVIDSQGIVEDIIRNLTSSGVTIDGKMKVRLEKMKLQLDYRNLEIDTRMASKRRELQEQKKNDQKLQRVFTWFAIAGFFIFAIVRGYLVHEVMVNDLDIPEFVLMTIADISAIFTAIIFTIKDYLFGGSVRNDLDTNTNPSGEQTEFDSL
jgi:hypothetical protein